MHTRFGPPNATEAAGFTAAAPAVGAGFAAEEDDDPVEPETALAAARGTAVLVPCDLKRKDMAESTRANTAATPSNVHVCWPHVGRLAPVKRL